MKKLCYSLLSIALISTYAYSASDVAESSATAKHPYPAIKECASKKAGDTCVLTPVQGNVAAMVALSGTCQIAPVTIEGVEASALRCEPKKLSVSEPASNEKSDEKKASSLSSATPSDASSETTTTSEASEHTGTLVAGTNVAAQAGAIPQAVEQAAQVSQQLAQGFILPK